jgi:hypothetical protein
VPETPYTVFGISLDWLIEFVIVPMILIAVALWWFLWR